MQGKRGDAAQWDTDAPCADHVDHHYIGGLTAASNDAAAQDHVCDLKRRDQGIRHQDLTGQRPYSRLHLKDLDIMTRRHNDANMLAMGAGMIGKNLAERIVEVFLNTAFEGGRHARRVGLIEDMEK